jgi:uncharacterized membrane protein YgdD (TMEM256/DUF423 family)
MYCWFNTVVVYLHVYAVSGLRVGCMYVRACVRACEWVCVCARTSVCVCVVYARFTLLVYTSWLSSRLRRTELSTQHHCSRYMISPAVAVLCVAMFCHPNCQFRLRNLNSLFFLATINLSGVLCLLVLLQSSAECCSCQFSYRAHILAVTIDHFK